MKEILGVDESMWMVRMKALEMTSLYRIMTSFQMLSPAGERFFTLFY